MTTFVERAKQEWGRAVYGAVVVGLLAGMFFERLGLPAATYVFEATCGLLVALPIFTVFIVLIDEIRRRDWIFALVAALVLSLIGATIATRLWL